MVHHKISFMLMMLIAITPFTGYAQESRSSIEDLDHQMKDFFGRVRIYYKCLRGQCPSEKHSKIKWAAAQDTAAGVVLIGAAIAGVLGARYNRYLKDQAWFEKSIDQMISGELKTVPDLKPEQYVDIIRDNVGDEVTIKLIWSKYSKKELRNYDDLIPVVHALQKRSQVKNIGIFVPTSEQEGDYLAWRRQDNNEWKMEGGIYKRTSR